MNSAKTKNEILKRLPAIGFACLTIGLFSILQEMYLHRIKKLNDSHNYIAFTYGLNLQQMRILYTILFFADTILLVFLTYIFLQRFDLGGNLWAAVLILAGIVICIFLLVLLLRSYIKQPPGRWRDDK